MTSPICQAEDDGHGLTGGGGIVDVVVDVVEVTFGGTGSRRLPFKIPTNAPVKVPKAPTRVMTAGAPGPNLIMRYKATAKRINDIANNMKMFPPLVANEFRKAFQFGKDSGALSLTRSPRWD